jgi:hypothetical protein
MATATAGSRAPITRGEGFALAGLLAAAAALRWLAWERTAVLFSDGPRFLAIARAFDTGAWSAALRDAFHPLYPLALAASHRALPLGGDATSWETAGALVSVAAGTAAVGGLFWFLRDAFGSAVAWIGAALLAVHWRAVEYASDVQSDALYLALFAGGLALGFSALRRASVSRAAAAGVASGLAYLTRPEGLGLALVLASLGAVEALRARWPLARALSWLGALAAAALLVSAPYLVGLRSTTGAWVLTQKKSLTGPPADAPGGVSPPPWNASLGAAAPTGVDPAWLDPEYRESDGMKVMSASSPADRALEATRMLGRTGKSALGYPVLVFAAFGLLAARGRPGARGLFVAALLLLYGAVLYGLAAGAGYVSRRHALPPLLPAFGYAALGALAAGAAARRLLGGSERAARAETAAVLLVVAGSELSRHLEPKRAEERAGRAAAEWLRDHAREPGPVAASRQRLGYYAGMPYVPLAGIADGALAPYLARSGARYVLLDDPQQVDALMRAEGSQVRLMHRLEAAGGTAWVFERGVPR